MKADFKAFNMTRSCMLLVGAVQRAANDVPIVDPPERVAGFFKLNRTKDAHMFYFYYESRSKGANDPVILWMTGQQGRAASVACMLRLDCTLGGVECILGGAVHNGSCSLNQPCH